MAGAGGNIESRPICWKEGAMQRPGEENSYQRNTEWAGQGWLLWLPCHCPGLSPALVIWWTPLIIPFCPIAPFHSSLPLWCFPAERSAALQRAGGTWWRWDLLGRPVILLRLSKFHDSNYTSLHILTFHSVPGTVQKPQVHYIICFLHQPREGALFPHLIDEEGEEVTCSKERHQWQSWDSIHSFNLQIFNECLSRAGWWDLK